MQHTIIQGEHHIWHITRFTAANHIAGGNGKRVVGKWQHTSSDIIEGVHGGYVDDAEVRHVWRDHDSIDRSVSIERDGPAEVDPSRSESDHFNTYWGIWWLCTRESVLRVGGWEGANKERKGEKWKINVITT